MEEGDDEVGFRFLKISFEPLGHRSGGTAVEVMGIETDEVDLSVVEGIVCFFSGWETAGFAFGRANVGIIIRACTRLAF